jgi:hypothetical protein
MRISACAGGEMRLPSRAASSIILTKAVRISAHPFDHITIS